MCTYTNEENQGDKPKANKERIKGQIIQVN